MPDWNEMNQEKSNVALPQLQQRCGIFERINSTFKGGNNYYLLSGICYYGILDSNLKIKHPLSE